MRRVIIETPFAGNFWHRYLNRRYARQCLRDSLDKGEAPFASHLLYPQVLDDGLMPQRFLGMAAGWEWTVVADACIVYVDRGISRGMAVGIERAEYSGIPIEYRALNPAHQLGLAPAEPAPQLSSETTDRSLRAPPAGQ